ncbi:MAG: dihydrodipicolinate reductase [Acidobacteria bacterium]|nr:dihydrodipicolinate reductase [Acidobacteriota bacterium]
MSSDTAPHRLALVGYGKMGRMIESLAPEFGFDVGLRLDEFNNADGVGITSENFEKIDVAIDFSIPPVVAENADRIAALGVNVVIGTTGWLDDLPRVRTAVERDNIGLVYGANFSVGVQVFYRIVEAAAAVLASEDDYDAWAYEIHHKMKKDAPSGTLLRLVEKMKESGYTRNIDTASNRAGAVPGIHQIGFDSEADTIQLVHTARSRVGFARGALRAARWIVGRKGLYEFSTVWDRMTDAPSGS